MVASGAFPKPGHTESCRGSGPAGPPTPGGQGQACTKPTTLCQERALGAAYVKT